MAKKRANGEGTIRRREDRNGWEARYYDAKGNRHSVYGKTQAEVRKRLAEAAKEEEEDSDLDEVDLTVGQWLAIWQRDFLGNVKPGTALNYESVIRVHILPVIGDIKLIAQGSGYRRPDWIPDKESDQCLYPPDGSAGRDAASGHTGSQETARGYPWGRIRGDHHNGSLHGDALR